MSLTALIAEDEGPQRRALSRLLASAWPELQIVAECEDGTSAVAALHGHRPTVAFLDIRMAGKTGLEVAQQACQMTHVVFTTAYEQHAVRAFEIGAVDYLLKPITAERLDAAVGRLRARVAETPPIFEAAVEVVRAALQSARTRGISWITATIGHTVKLIPVEHVLFFQAGDKCTRVITREGEAIIRTPLRDLLQSLDPDAFWQVHRSVIVQVSAIDTIRRNELGRLELTLHGCAELLPVSQQFQYRFRGM